MPYEKIPGVRAAFLDGAFKIPTTSTQPKILIIGPASSGLTNEIFNVAAISGAEKEFGAETPIMRAAHEALAINANNISVIRSGGRQGSVVITDDNGGTLTIQPESRDDEILERYALILEGERVLVYDLESENFVYDSSEIEVLDVGTVSVINDGFESFTLNDRTDPTNAIKLSALTSADPVPENGVGIDTVVKTEGTDGMAPSLVERYAALATTYHMLDYKDADIIVPCDVFLDDANIADDESVAEYGYFWGGVPTANSSSDKLGFVWHYIYRGKIYTYFTDTSDYFSVDQEFATVTVATDLEITAEKSGIGGNACSITITNGGSVSAGISESANGSLHIALVAVVGTTTTSTAATAINNALAAFTTSRGLTGDQLLSASGASTVIAATVSQTFLADGAGGHYLSHSDLTGDNVPDAVQDLFEASEDATLRECNFAHQLASHCYGSSVAFKAMIGTISTKGPSNQSRLTVADWVGNLPTYTDNGEYVFIDSPGENGNGLLGNKFMAGQAKSSAGYRSALCTEGDSTDGYAYGGLILTVGRSLPNGVEFPYGIDSSDEAVDSGQKPIDIGKHIFITYDWPIISTGYNGGSVYRGNIAALFAGKVCTLPENVEPIGDNGALRRVQNPPRIHATQLNDLAAIRLIGMRLDDTAGYILVSAKTAAHPDSDYTRISTIRCVNRILSGIRKIARPYIGKAFSSQQLVSMQSAMEQYLLGERQAGMHQGAKIRLEYSRSDKIMGKLKIKLRMVPPFAIESIDVETSLAAEESEL